MTESVKNLFFRAWYWYISSIDKKAEVTFMNYGFSKDNHKITLDDKDESNRYSAQLYDYLAQHAPIKGKDILEVGCGRGGGLSYVTRYYAPKSATGLDLSKKAIEFCSGYYAQEGIRFVQGDAQCLPFPDQSFDVVLNVESSHRYPDMEKFLAEANRVLRPGGHFLFTDFRPDKDMAQLKKQLDDSGFKQLKDELITDSVVEALSAASTDREELIKKLAPKFLHEVSKDFAATKGTRTYNRFSAREWVYFFYTMQK